MGRKVLLAVTCWLAITSALGEPEKNENTSKDSASEESAPSPLYHNIPNAVYASAVPYGSFSFNFPTFAAAPKTAASQIAPATVGYLKDSYGNKFVDTLQSAAYRTIPQQYVSLQSLPSHLSQPLVSAPTYQLKQGPQYYFGTQYRSPNYQAAPPTVRYAGVPQPYVYAQSVAPAYSHDNTYSTPQGGHNVHHSGPSIPKGEANHLQYVKQAYPVRHYENNQHATQSERVQQQAVPEKLTATINTENGKQTVIFTTKPNVPLLDLNLLEPLKFNNPLVPQIQHFLPRIHGATYQKLPQYTSTSGNRQQAENALQKPKTNNNHQYEEAPKRQPKPPPPTRHNKPKTYNKIPEIISPIKTTIINSPNHKEIINEQIISYNKETTSDPVIYSYNMHSAEDPNKYKYNQKTVEPVKEVNYSRGPKQVISHSFEQSARPAPPPPRWQPPPQSSSEASDEQSESSAESEEETPSDYQRDEQNQDRPNRRPEHSGEEFRYDKNQDEPHNVYHRPRQHQTPPQQSFKVLVHNPETGLQPIRPDYDRDILQSNYKPNSNIKVDPNQHVRHYTTKITSTPRRPQQAQRPQSRPPAHNYRPQNYDEPVAHVHEKSKRVIIQEETPDEMHSHDEQMSGEMISQEENNEADFEKAYKYAAYGFPAYESSEAADPEKDIYNPESYVTPDGKGDYKDEYDPFQKYRIEEDAYPISAIPSYKDSLEKMKEEYALEYGINKPTSMLDRFKNKENYLKTYEKYKPAEYFSVPVNRKPKQKSKYTAASSHESYAAKPKSYEYNYSKETPRDSSAFASRPNHKYKNKTFFVEPQFQYGFEPISIPRLLDSEIAAATLRDPESEKPAMRKKIYKENWYIKKTSTSGGNPSS